MSRSTPIGTIVHYISGAGDGEEYPAMVVGVTQGVYENDLDLVVFTVLVESGSLTKFSVGYSFHPNKEANSWHFANEGCGK